MLSCVACGCGDSLVDNRLGLEPWVSWFTFEFWQAFVFRNTLVGFDPGGQPIELPS